MAAIHFGDNLTMDLVPPGWWARLMGDHTAFRPQGEIDGLASLGTLDTLASDGEGPGRVPPLLLRDGEALRAPAVFSFTVGEAPTNAEAGWAVIDQAVRTGVVPGGATSSAGADDLTAAELRTLVLKAAEADAAQAAGSVMRRLEAGPETVRTPLSVRVGPAAPRQLLLHGALGRFPPGFYDLRVQATLAEGPGAVCLVLDRDRVAAASPCPPRTGPTVEVTFAVAGEVAAPLAFVLISEAGAVLDVRDVVIH